MYKLYERPNAGNAVVEAVLAETGQQVELIRVERDANRLTPAWFKDINPRGEVPTLVLPDGTLMMESAAIVIYLADLYPKANLAPPVSSPLRARYLQWIMFFATAVYGANLRGYYPEKYVDGGGAQKNLLAKAEAEGAEALAIFAKALGPGPYVLGHDFSAADLYAAMLISWTTDQDALWARHPQLLAYYDRIAARPAIKPVWARNKMRN